MESFDADKVLQAYELIQVGKSK
jgi:hypothetical protein